MIRNSVYKMSAMEVAQLVLNGKELFILDVRNETDFADWKIEGHGVEIINIPYFDLLDGIEPALEHIPNERPVLVVCSKEGSSKFIAEQIVESGRSNISYLEGGMKTWSEYLEPVKVADLTDGGELYQFVRIGKGCLSYVVISEDEATIIDSNRMIEQYENFLYAKGAKVTHLIDTHLHADHISGGVTLAQKHGATYHLPEKDAVEVTFNYESLEANKDIVVGKQRIVVQPIHSPGHTIGSTSLIVDNKYLLSGDILFIESIGRPDLAGQAEDWVGDLRETLYSRYKSLPEDLTVLPAHFGKVTELGKNGLVSGRLGELYKKNPGLNIMDENEFRIQVTEQLPPQPNAYQEIRQTNMGQLNPSEDEQREMEIGPNRCAVHDN